MDEKKGKGGVDGEENIEENEEAVEYPIEELIERFDILKTSEEGAHLIDEYRQERKLEDIDVKELNNIFLKIVDEIQNRRTVESIKSYIRLQLILKGEPADDNSVNDLFDQLDDYARKTK